MSTSNPLSGFLDEVPIGRIRHPRRSLRIDLGVLDELMASIARKGLLQPLVVRPTDGKFEVVAGNRRLEACKLLGVHKVACHIVDMDEKEAFEISLVENIQRQTLDPIEEAQAFKRYTDEFGYGSFSELALKIGKSEEYVSHRVGLLTLPEAVLDKVSRRQLTPSHAAELKGLKVEEQHRITRLIVEEHITSKDVRRLVHQSRLEEALVDPVPCSYSTYSRMERDGNEGTVDRTFGKCIAALKITMMRFDSALNDLEDDEEWATKEILIENRRMIHGQIDNMMRLRKKTRRARVYLERHGI